MEIIRIIIFLGIIFIVVSLFLKSKNNKNSNIFKKIILGIIYFVIFFIAYYFIIAMVSLIPLYFISENSGEGSDSGLWAYGLVLGTILSPILSIITTVKILNNKDRNKEASK